MAAVRDPSLDVARGIAMVLVVLGHALVGMIAAGHGTQAARFALILIYSTHMALFFWVSGFLSGGMARRPWPEFGRLMLVRMVWPYLLWSVVLVTLHFLMSDYTNTRVDRPDYLSILWRPPAVMWFLYVLAVALLLRRLLVHLSSAATILVGAAIVATAYFLPPEWLNLRFIGLVLVAAQLRPQWLDRAMTPAGLTASAAAMAVTAFLAWNVARNGTSGYPAGEPVFIPALVAGPVLLLALSRWIASGKPRALGATLQRVGQRTMPIFVTHVPIVAGTRIGLRLMGIESWGLILAVATVLGIALPMAAAALADRWRLSPILGWR